MADETTESFPYEINDVNPNITSTLLKEFTGERTGFVQVGPQKYFFPYKFRAAASDFWNFQARPDDVWLVSFPRSGTTLTQEMVWMIVNDLNFTGIEQNPVNKRFPFFESHIFLHDDVKQELLLDNADDPENLAVVENYAKNRNDLLNEVTDRRFIKTHFPFSLLPPSVRRSGAKIIYVARNPKDVAVSYYHLNRLDRTLGYNGNFENYWNYFEHDLNPWMPYWAHVNEGWQHRHDDNVLFLFYEDMIRDQPATIRRVAAFLDKTLTDAQVDRLQDYLRIENFKNNPSVNQNHLKAAKIYAAYEQGYVRNGKTTVNGWQKEYTPAIIERVERWMAKHLAETDMRFPDSQ